MSTDPGDHRTRCTQLSFCVLRFNNSRTTSESSLTFIMSVTALQSVRMESASRASAAVSSCCESAVIGSEIEREDLGRVVLTMSFNDAADDLIAFHEFVRECQAVCVRDFCEG